MLGITHQFVEKTTLLDDYLQEIGRYPLLTAQEELTLGKRIQQGDTDARNTLVNHNLRLVVYFAKKYVKEDNILDLIQEGSLGLLKAAEKYDPNRGFRFSTYAVFWIRLAMQRFLTKDHVVRFPESVNRDLKKVNRAIGDLEQIMSREPTEEEVAAEMGLDVGRVHDVMTYRKGTVSFDQGYGEDENGNLYDVLGLLVNTMDEVGDDIDNIISWEKVEANLDLLPPREAHVLKVRFGLQNTFPHTLEEVGKELSVSKERVRQIELRAIERMKEWTSLDTVASDGKTRTKRPV